MDSELSTEFQEILGNVDRWLCAYVNGISLERKTKNDKAFTSRGASQLLNQHTSNKIGLPTI